MSFLSAQPGYTYQGTFFDQFTPPLGSEVQIFVPKNQIWRIRSIRAKYVVSATAGTRQVQGLMLYSLATIGSFATATSLWFWASGQFPNMAPSITYYLGWVTGYPVSCDGSFDTATIRYARANLLDVPLPEGFSFSTKTVGLDTSDQYTYMFSYELWTKDTTGTTGTGPNKEQGENFLAYLRSLN